MLSDEEDLRAKLDQQAVSLHDRVQILDARDKYLRLHRERQTNIETAKAVLGSCPDMCPEYERYFREENKQLSPLEITNGEPDPHAMVKEYRRAGADQEEPLPHELRSPEILSRTMDYLICNIIDRVEHEAGIVGDWYDFIWSRSRAIRKDITQQHLCDPISVSLLEKCARFHIHCDHALCEVDAMIFDTKINNENLSKCLQSLKDFYNDLHLKGIHCPNEPEFRGYYLLLNLTRPDILREVKLLDNSVRSSPPVQFALKCHFAMATNNFVKFFDLVKSTTYLNACILHRYFYDVRLQAFKVMRKAFTITNQIESYAYVELMRLLGFEHEQEIEAFCESIGLECENDSVILKRGRTNDGRASMQSIRSKRLIESKRKEQPLSEIIHGGPLPENPYRKFPLLDSFDQIGRLKKDAMFGHDKRPRSLLGYQDKHQLTPQVSQPQTPSPPFNEIKQLVAAKIAQQIFGEVIRDFVRDFVRQSLRQVELLMKRATIMNQEAERLTQSLIAYIINETIRNAFHKVQQEKKAEEARIRGYRAAVDTISSQLCQSLLTHHIYITIKQIASQALNEQIQDHNVRKSRILTEALIDEIVSETIEEKARICYEQLRKQEELINCMQKKRLWRLARDCFWLWRRKCLKAKRYKQIKETFPAANIENMVLKVESFQLKRKLSSSELVGSPTNSSTKHLKESPTKRELHSELMTETLKPKMFASQVANLSITIDPTSNLEDLSPLDKLKRKLEQEKEMGQVLKHSIETFKLSLSYSESADNDEDNLTAVSV